MDIIDENIYFTGMVNQGGCYLDFETCEHLLNYLETGLGKSSCDIPSGPLPRDDYLLFPFPTALEYERDGARREFAIQTIVVRYDHDIEIAESMLNLQSFTCDVLLIVSDPSQVDRCWMFEPIASARGWLLIVAPAFLFQNSQYQVSFQVLSCECFENIYGAVYDRMRGACLLRSGLASVLGQSVVSYRALLAHRMSRRGESFGERIRAAVPLLSRCLLG